MEKYGVLHPFTVMPDKAALGMDGFAGIYTVAKQGQGSWVTDIHGEQYLNVSNAALSLGCGHHELIDAVVGQYRTLSVATLFAQGHEPAFELARQLCERMPHYDMVVYANDGSGAVEAALKIARQYYVMKGERRRKAFISLQGGYHGTSYGAMSVSAMGFEPLFGPSLKPCYYVPAPNKYRPLVAGCTDAQHSDYAVSLMEEQILQADPETIAAVIVEPIQGVNGIIVFPDCYLSKVRALTQKYGILLIVDEVGTGLGRTGRWLASDRAGVRADIMALSKGLTAGYFPLGATLLSPEVSQAFCGENGGFPHGSTLAGHPVGCAAALAMLRLLDGGLIERARRVGNSLMEELTVELAGHPYVGDVRGAGLMVGIEFVSDKERRAKQSEAFGRAFRERLRSQRIIAPYYDGILSLFPPLNVQQIDIEYLTESIIGSVKECEAEAEGGQY